MKPVITTLAALAFGSALSAAPASATPPPPPRSSTDCAARVYVIDDLVCGSPELLALDRQVAEAFAAAPDATNPEWPRMVEGQGGWYYRSRQCFKARDQAACLKAAYADRLTELAILAAPPAAGAGQAARCEGPPWVGGREVRLNGAPGGPLTLSDPSGQIMAIALAPGRTRGWSPFFAVKRASPPIRLEHQNGAAYLVCTPR